MNEDDFDAIATSRALLRGATTATLASLLAPDGEPYASLALVAFDHDLAPVLLLSDLAEHAKNIAADARISLLFDGTRGLEEPLTGQRLSLQGRAARSADPSVRARYLARHPDAEGYADFGDFAFYAVQATRAHLVAGFGRIAWLDWADVAVATPEPLRAAEGDIVAHMNEDHGDAIDLMAARLGGADGTGWRMAGIDGHGFDLRRGSGLVRLTFDGPIRDASEARAALVALTQRAREAGN